MAKKNFPGLEERKILWHDRKRILGLPISFTVYEVDEERLTIRKGFFTTTTDDIVLYRILDVQMKRTLGQKLVGVGSITLFSADQTDRTFVIENVKQSEDVCRFFKHIVEEKRQSRNVTGREMFGAAAGMMSGPPDLDGDGIPDAPPMMDMDDQQ